MEENVPPRLWLAAFTVASVPSTEEKFHVCLPTSVSFMFFECQQASLLLFLNQLIACRYVYTFAVPFYLLAKWHLATGFVDCGNPQAAAGYVTFACCSSLLLYWNPSLATASLFEPPRLAKCHLARRENEVQFVTLMEEWQFSKEYNAAEWSTACSLRRVVSIIESLHGCITQWIRCIVFHIQHNDVRVMCRIAWVNYR